MPLLEDRAGSEPVLGYKTQTGSQSAHDSMQANIIGLKGLKLVAVTSTNTCRYNNSTYVQLCSRVINPGPTFRGNVSSTSKWQRFVHPEGQPYFVLPNEFAFTVITEANVEDEQTRNQIVVCIARACEQLYCQDLKLPLRCELFLELADDQATCNYYFIDHIDKALFWLEEVCTELLDIPPAACDSHLDMELQRLYWVHVEYFPMHHESQQQFSHMVDDLYNIISHGQADRLTSKTSTFPYTADTCMHFLKLLSNKRGQRVDGYTLCYAARLAGAIANQRFVTFYGQRPAQLDRLQEMFAVDAVQHKWLLKLANALMWGIPLHYINLLDDLYVNEQVYADQWTRFMGLCLRDWTTSLSWSLPVFVASVLLANVRGGTLSTSIPSVLASAVSIASASCLHLRHQPLAESSASVGARYLRSARSNTVGFLPSSVAFSLPRASYLWGVGLLTAQFLFVASQSVSKLVAMVAAAVIAATLLFMLCVIYPEEASIGTLCESVTSLGLPRWNPLDVRPEGSIV